MTHNEAGAIGNTAQLTTNAFAKRRLRFMRRLLTSFSSSCKKSLVGCHAACAKFVQPDEKSVCAIARQ